GLARARASAYAAAPDVGERLREIGDALRPEDLQLLAEALERMAAHVEAERFLLEGELLRPRPRRPLRQRDRGAGIVAVPAAAEQRVLPFFAVALVPAAVPGRPLGRAPRT